MSTEQTLSAFETKRQEVINRLLGSEKRFSSTPDITTKFTDPSWLTGKPAPARLVKNALDDASMRFLAGYNAELRRNGGKIIRRMSSTETLKEIPPPIK